MNEFFWENQNIATSDIIGVIIFFALLLMMIIWILFSDRLAAKNILDVGGAREHKRNKRKSNLDRIALRFYSGLEKLPFVKKRIIRLQTTYRDICPYDEGTLASKTVKTVIKCTIASFVTAFLALLINLIAVHEITIWALLCAVLAVMVTWTEITQMDINNLRGQIMNNLSIYFSNVKHVYASIRNVSVSVIEAADELPYEMQVHARQVYEILNAFNARDRVNEYVTNRNNNRYLRLFVGQAYEAMEQGDLRKKGESLFEKNLEILRVEMLDAEITMLEKRYRLSGLAFIALMPTFFMAVFKKWGMEFDEGTHGFYQAYGPFIEAITYVVTILIYRLINKSKSITEHRDDFDDENKIFKKITKTETFEKLMERFSPRGRSKVDASLRNTGSNMSVAVFYAKSIIFGLAGFIAVCLFILYVHKVEKNDYLTNLINFDNKVVTTNRNRENIKNTVLSIIDEYKDADMSKVSDEVLLAEVEERIHLPNISVKESMIDTVKYQINGYQTEGWKWYDIFIGLCGFFFGLINLIELLLYDSLCRREKSTEVREFQLIVLLEKDFDGVTIFSILTEMETHALMYKDKLRRALILFNESRDKAIELLRDDDNRSFKCLMDGFKNVDAVGIKEAFAEVESNIISDEKVEKLYDEISFERRRNAIELFAYIPAVLVIGIYFVLPFLLSSLEGVMEIFHEIEEIQNITGSGGI